MPVEGDDLFLSEAAQQAPSARDLEAERIAEALVFASAEPVAEAFLVERLPRGVDVRAIMSRLARLYAGRGRESHPH